MKFWSTWSSATTRKSDYDGTIGRCVYIYIYTLYIYDYMIIYQSWTSSFRFETFAFVGKISTSTRLNQRRRRHNRNETLGGRRWVWKVHGRGWFVVKMRMTTSEIYILIVFGWSFMQRYAMLVEIDSMTLVHLHLWPQDKPSTAWQSYKWNWQWGKSWHVSNCGVEMFNLFNGLRTHTSTLTTWMLSLTASPPWNSSLI